MKQIRLIKITPTGRKLVTMQESIWNTILKDSSMVPAGVTYELAPKDEMKAIELIETVKLPKQEVPVESNIGGGIAPPIEDVEPIQVFTPEMVEEKEVKVVPKKGAKEQPKKRK